MIFHYSAPGTRSRRYPGRQCSITVTPGRYRPQAPKGWQRDNPAEHGGEVVRPPYPEGDLWVATFSDPAGNVLGVWQHGPRQ